MIVVLSAALVTAAIFFAAPSLAADCNPKAITHQQKAAQIRSFVDVGGLPPQADQDFLICMLQEKEDKDAYRQRIQKAKAEHAAAEARQAAEQRAAVERAAAQKRQEQAQINQFISTLPAGIPPELSKAAVAYFAQQSPKAMYVAWDIQRGQAVWATAYTYDVQSNAATGCNNLKRQNGVQSPCSAFLSNNSVVWKPQSSALKEGRYAKSPQACGNKPTAGWSASGVFVVSGDQIKMDRNSFTLTGSDRPNVFNALNNGGGSMGYNGQVIVSGSSFRWSGYGMDEGPYQNCSENSSVPTFFRGERPESA